MGDTSTTKVLGGTWTRKHKRKAADATIGIVVGGAPKGWGRQHGLNIEASFAHNKYGKDKATSLALEWCRRMNHFCEVFLLRNELENCYSPEDIAPYEEGLPWLDFLCAQDLDSEVWSRAEITRSTKPDGQPCPKHKSSSSKRKA